MTFGEFRFPKIKNIEAQFIDRTTVPNMVDIGYDTIYYDVNKMEYKSREQYDREKILEEKLKAKDLELQEKVKEKENSLKSLISYFYKSRT